MVNEGVSKEWVEEGTYSGKFLQIGEQKRQQNRRGWVSSTTRMEEESGNAKAYNRRHLCSHIGGPSCRLS